MAHSSPRNRLYDAYSFHVIPGMGKAIANDEDSYRYLVESIRKFPTQPKFAQMISEAGFEHVAWENLTLGVAAIHSGFKMPPTLKGPSEEAKSQ